MKSRRFVEKIVKKDVVFANSSVYCTAYNPQYTSPMQKWSNFALFFETAVKKYLKK